MSRVVATIEVAGLVLMTVLTGGAGPTAAAEDPPFRETILVRVDAKTGPGNVKAEYVDAASGKAAPKPGTVSDIWLRLWHPTVDVNEVIARPNVASPRPDEAAMTIELFSVVDGKLHSDTTGTCAPWSGDTAWCTYGCDGQGFVLKRASQKAPRDLRILLAAKMPKAPRQRGPLVVTLCGADDQGREIRIVPAGGKAEGEIKLGSE